LLGAFLKPFYEYVHGNNLFPNDTSTNDMEWYNNNVELRVRK